MKKRLLSMRYFMVLAIFMMVSANSYAQDSLLISEYIEGSSNNKAVELYNASEAEIDLSSYHMLRANNGATEWSDTLSLEGTLAPGAVYVIANSSAAAAILDVADTTHSLTFYNGNDALALEYNNNGTWETIDVIGVLGEDQKWSVAGVAEATGEHTLVRKKAVETGETDWALSAGTDEESSQWMVFDTDEFGFIGTHDSVATAPAAPVGFVANDGNNAGEVFVAVGPNNVGSNGIEYRLFYSETASAPGDPLTATEYTFGSTAGDGEGNAAFGFNIAGLTPGTDYTFWLYQYDTTNELYSDPTSDTAVSGAEQVETSPPTTNAAEPAERDSANVVSIYGDFYSSIDGVNYNPNWGQSGFNDVNTGFDPGTGDTILAYPNFNYQGTEFAAQDLSGMDYVHIDIWVAEGTERMVKFTPIDNSGNGAGEVLVEVPLTPGSWNSVDLPKSMFTDMTWESVFQLKFDGQFNADGSANTEPYDVYVDNIFFYAGEPVTSGPEAPTTNAEEPAERDSANVVSIYGDFYSSIDGVNYNPNWGQSGFNDLNTGFDPGTGDTVLAYPNFNYQGTEFAAQDLSGMDYVHIDIWVAEGTNRMVKFTPIDNSGNGPGEVLVEVPVTPGSWNSVDLPKSMFTDMSWESVFQLKFDGQFNADGTANTEPYDVYVDNIFFYGEGEAMEITSIADARTFQDSSLVISGIASTPNYGFNNGQWYLQDETGGINVFFDGEGDIEVAAGDEHILYGTISSFNDQIQIAVDSAEVVSTGNDVFVYEIELAEFLNVESEMQGMFVTLLDTATYLSEVSAWPVEGFSDWDGAGTDVFFQVGDDTLTYRIDRDEAFYDGTVEPENGAEFILSGILARYNDEAQFYGGFFDDDIAQLGDVPQPTDNLVANGDFESGDTGAWYGNAFNIETEDDNSYNFADVASAGNPWDVNLSQDVELTPGEYYELTFEAVTDSGNTRTVVVGIGQSQAPFYAATHTIVLTDTVTTFTLGLPAVDDGTGTPFGETTSRVIFDMGADVGVVALDNVSLEVAEAPMEITPIGEARALQDSSLAISGIASTPNYGFNHGQWFIQDETGGINVIFFDQGDLEVAPGDEHILYGTISSFNGQVQIDVDSAEVVSTDNDVFVYEVGLEEFLNVESELQGMYVSLTETAIYLAEESAWPVEGFSDWDGSGTNVFFQVGDDTLTYRIDRDEAFYDGTAEPEDGAEVSLSGILARFDEEAQFYGAFFEDDILSDPVSNESELIPEKFTLEQNYPNPFNPSTKIEFALPETGKAQIEVFNMLGQRVATLVNSQFSAGRHTITFNANGLTSGIYFYRLTTGSSTMTKRMTLIK